jgi:hypothetical protein
VLGVIALMAVLPATPAFAQSTLKPTSGQIGVVVGQSPKSPGKTQFPAGLIRVQFSDGSEGWAYCIEIARPLTFGVDYEEAHWDDTLIPASTLGTIAYILRAYGPDAGYSSQNQGMAVQSAIWHFTDGFELDPAANPSDIVTLYQEIVTKASDPANTTAQPAPSLAINPAVGNGVSGQLVPFTVDGANWSQPVAVQVDSATPAGSTATIVDCTDGTTAITQVGSPGAKICLKLAGGDGTGQASISAKTTGASVPSGRAFVAQESTNVRQKIILSSSVRSEASAAAQVNFVPAPTTTTTTPTTTPSTTPSTTPGSTPSTTPGSSPQGGGSLGFEVRKDVEGGGGAGPFTFQVACAGATLDPADAQFTLDVIPGNGVPNVHDFQSTVPVGTVCTITETDRGGASNTQVRVNEGTPRGFAQGATPTVDLTLRGDIAIAVRFTNVIPTGSPQVPQQVPTTRTTPTTTGTLPLTGAGKSTDWGWPIAVGLLTVGGSLLAAGNQVRRRTSLPGG